MRDCIPSPSGPGPSADGIWHGLLPVQALMQPDVPVPPGARVSVVVQQGQIQWVGPDAAAARLANVLVNDCGSGVMRHADAGYELAVETAKKQGLKLPMVPGAR